MLRVMLVEDEPPVMRMVKKTLENAAPDFMITRCCANGRAAVAAMEEESFDVVITDIKMPLMSGIELAGWIYDNRPDTMVIIISGYSDFEYARKALEYRVFGYLLKPVSESDVKELTDRVKNEIGKKPETDIRNRERNTVVVLACAGTYLLYGSEVMLPGEQFWSNEHIERFMEKELHPDESYIFFEANVLSERFVVIECEDTARQEAIVKKLYSEFEDSELPVTLVYKTGVMFKDAGKTFSSLRELLIKSLVPGKSKIIAHGNATENPSQAIHHYTKNDIEGIAVLIKNGNAEAVKESLTGLLSSMREAESTQEEINGLLNIILDTYTLNFPGSTERRSTSVKHEFVNVLGCFVSYDEFTEDVVSILMTLRSDSKSDRHSQFADSVEEYLKRNFDKNITSEILSREFGFVPSYISRIFKRQKGVSPNEYITKFRIETAKKLMAENPGMKIKEIADHVGFREPYYFSKTFKKETGMWPTEFVK